MRLRHIWLAILLGALAAVTALPVAADIIYLKGTDRTIEGEVIEQTKEYVSVKMPLGVVQVEREKIDRIEWKISPEAEYRRRLEHMDGDDWQGRLDLADWCEENQLAVFSPELREEARSIRYDGGLAKIASDDADGYVAFAQELRADSWPQEQVDRVLQLALVANPDHQVARRLLGYSLFEGRWLTSDEIDEIERVRHARAMREQGFVLYKGEWMSPETVALQQEADRLERLEAEVTRREVEVARKATEVARAEAEVAEKERDLAHREGMLSKGEDELAARWQDLLAREREVEAKEAWIEGRLRTLYHYESELERCRATLLGWTCSGCSARPKLNLPPINRSNPYHPR